MEELEEEPGDEEDDGGAQQALALKEVQQRSRLLEADQASSGIV